MVYDTKETIYFQTQSMKQAKNTKKNLPGIKHKVLLNKLIFKVKNNMMQQHYTE